MDSATKKGRKVVTVKAIIAIDPGANGGIAWCDNDGSTFVVAMPDGMSAQIDKIRELAASLPNAIVVMERVGGYVPGDSGPAACKFARHCGHIEAACYAFGLPVEQVAPQTWMKSIGALPKDKGARKRAIKEAMARRFPGLSVTLKTADALGILRWALTCYNSRRARRGPFRQSMGMAL